MLTKYGTNNIIVMLAVAAVLIAAAFFVNKSWLTYILAIAGIMLTFFTLWFFRDPDRNIPEKALKNDKIVLAPADGKIVQVIDAPENEFIGKDAVQISIFLSPLDVHVNRSPANGVVKYFEYFPGEYLVAYHDKASSANEQTHIGLENSAGRIFFKQIVGIIARRLVWDIKTGDTLEAGQRFGMMKFGSRMDIIIDAGSKINVEVGQSVVAGETIIAELP